MAKIGEDIEMQERRHEDRANEEARREEETDFIRDDGYGDNDFERLRNDYQSNFERDSFDLRFNEKSGDYEINFEQYPEDVYDTETFSEEVKKKITYLGMRHAFRRLGVEIGELRGIERLSYDFLDENNFFDQVKLRFNKEGKLLGLSYKIVNGREFVNIIVSKNRNSSELSFVKEYNEKGQETKKKYALDDFKKVMKNLKELYMDTPSDYTQQLVEDTFFDEGDKQSILSDEQIWAENQLIIQTRKAVFEEAEAKMEEYRDDILQDIKNEEDGENPFPDMESGQDFYSQVVYITDPISNQDWFSDEGWSLEGKRPSNEVYENEMNDIYDARKELSKRIKKATSGKQIMVYETLKGYLDYKEVSVKTYFDKKLQENRLVSLYRRLQRTKFYRRGVIKAARWFAKKFPKAMAGAIIGVITTAFGIYEAVEDMAGDVVSQGTKAINNISEKVDKVVKEQKKMIDKAVGNLDKRLKDAAEKQGKLVKDALDGLRKTLQPSSKLLKFLLDHIMWLIIAFVLWMIYITYLLTRKKPSSQSSTRPRVRVKYEQDD